MCDSPDPSSQKFSQNIMILIHRAEGLLSQYDRESLRINIRISSCSKFRQEKLLKSFNRINCDKYFKTKALSHYGLTKNQIDAKSLVHYISPLKSQTARYSICPSYQCLSYRSLTRWRQLFETTFLENIEGMDDTFPPFLCRSERKGTFPTTNEWNLISVHLSVSFFFFSWKSTVETLERHQFSVWVRGSSESISVIMNQGTEESDVNWDCNWKY